MTDTRLSSRAAQERAYHDQRMIQADFDMAPFTIAWEVTRACAFACKHCRADAQHQRDPNELTAEEGYRLIDRLAEFGSPILIFTGGDPMMRRDLFDLIKYAAQKGLRCSLTPTATALPTPDRLSQAKAAGIRRIALSLDAPAPETHDDFRQVPGSWERTMRILHSAKEVGLSVQVNTTVSTFNVDLLPEMVPFIQEVEAVQWSVFFLVPTGRAQAQYMISSQRHEEVFNWLYDLSQQASFDIKATAAPMYRRVAIQRKKAESTDDRPVTFQGAGFQYADGLHRPTKGVNDGNGFLFISHLGQIMPSGFLPIDCGNVREKDIVDVYRNHPVFKSLRNYENLKGGVAYATIGMFAAGSAAVLTVLPAITWKLIRLVRTSQENFSRRNLMTLNWIGLIAASTTFLGVWIGHVSVRKIEYLSPTIWVPSSLALILGLLLELGALVSENLYLSAALGIFGITILWDALEFWRQHQRVRKGHASQPEQPTPCTSVSKQSDDNDHRLVGSESYRKTAFHGGAPESTGSRAVNFFGLLLGFATLAIIGLGFIWVIRAEYYLGYLWWPYIMGMGALIAIGSLFAPSNWGSALLGILGASVIWGSTELKEQAVRAEIGWYPYNPKAKPDPPFVETIKNWPAPHL